MSTITSDGSWLCPKDWCCPCWGSICSDIRITEGSPLCSIRQLGGEALENFHIYPNPTRDDINISFSSLSKQDLGIRIINVVGAEVYREDRKEFVGEYTKQITLGDSSKGIYFLEINDNQGTITKKIILQ